MVESLLDTPDGEQRDNHPVNNVLLSVQDLVTYFFTEEGIVRAVEGVSFEINVDEVVGLVGETGCGKSVTALSIIRLVRQPGKIMAGHVIFKGEDLVDATEARMRQIRGKDITMIFQDPMNSLNPVYTVEKQLNEVFLLHQKQELLAMQNADKVNWAHKTHDDFLAIENQLVELKSLLSSLKLNFRALKRDIHGIDRIVLRVNKGLKIEKIHLENILPELQNVMDIDQDQIVQKLKDKKEELKNVEDEMARVKMDIHLLRVEKKNPSRRKLTHYATLLSIKALKEVKIHTPEKVIKSYPHELSGGMRQRVMIAMGLACNPELLIADEPTTALDVTIQAQILDLMRQLKKKLKTSILIITHDLGTIAEMCDRVAVMYSGRIVEYGNVYFMFKSPQHPYTMGLMKSIPDISLKVDRLSIIPGTVPNLIYPPSGCRFHPRCPYRMVICDKQLPPLYEVAENYFSACFLHAKNGKIYGLHQENAYTEEMFKPLSPDVEMPDFQFVKPPLENNEGDEK